MKSLREFVKRAISLRGLILRAAVFALAWYFLPFWAFFLVALYLYLIPLFQPGKLFWPFCFTLFFSFIEVPGFWLAVILGALFYLILGIKDLVFVDRPAAYETFVLAAVFLAFIGFFAYFNSGYSSGALWGSLFLTLLLFVLWRGFLSYTRSIEPRSSLAKERDIFLAVATLVIWQISLATLFLTISYVLQAGVMFLTVAVPVEWSKYYLDGGLNKARLLWGISVFLAVWVAVLGAGWGI